MTTTSRFAEYTRARQKEKTTNREKKIWLICFFFVTKKSVKCRFIDELTIIDWRILNRYYFSHTKNEFETPKTINISSSKTTKKKYACHTHYDYCVSWQLTTSTHCPIADAAFCYCRRNTIPLQSHRNSNTN